MVAEISLEFMADDTNYSWSNNKTLPQAMIVTAFSVVFLAVPCVAYRNLVYY